MKTIIAIIAASVAFCNPVVAQTNVADLATQIIGVWQAGEAYMPQPPPEMQQDIKAITLGEKRLTKGTGFLDREGHANVYPLLMISE